MSTEGLDEAEYERALRVELDRRLAELAREGERAFGRMGGADLFFIAVLCLVGPALLVWWFR